MEPEMSSSTDGTTKILITFVILIAAAIFILVKRDANDRSFEVAPEQVEGREAYERFQSEVLAEFNADVESLVEEQELGNLKATTSTDAPEKNESTEQRLDQDSLAGVMVQVSQCIGYFRFRVSTALDTGTPPTPWIERQERFEAHRVTLLDDTGFSAVPDPLKRAELGTYGKLQEFRHANPDLAEKQYLEAAIFDPQCTEADRIILKKYE